MTAASGDTHAAGMCVFCPIPPQAQIVREWKRNGHVVAFVPLNPVTEGHILIMPSAHVADVAESPRLTAEVMRCAAEYAAEVGDCNVITSKGAAATQTVMHLHVHIVPRREGDGLALPWTGQRTPTVDLEMVDRAAARLREVEVQAVYGLSLGDTRWAAEQVLRAALGIEASPPPDSLPEAPFGMQELRDGLAEATRRYDDLKARLEALRGLSEAATPGEWRAVEENDGRWLVEPVQGDIRYRPVAVMLADPDDPETFYDAQPDAAFIAALVNLCRELLAEDAAVNHVRAGMETP